MIAWATLRCLYLSIGGLLAPALLTRLLIRDRGGEALGNPALALIAALGTVDAVAGAFNADVGE